MRIALLLAALLVAQVTGPAARPRCMQPRSTTQPAPAPPHHRTTAPARPHHRTTTHRSRPTQGAAAREWSEILGGLLGWRSSAGQPPAAGESPWFCHSLDCPPYEVLETLDDLELRRYSKGARPGCRPCCVRSYKVAWRRAGCRAGSTARRRRARRAVGQHHGAGRQVRARRVQGLHGALAPAALRAARRACHARRRRRRRCPGAGSRLRRPEPAPCPPAHARSACSSTSRARTRRAPRWR
jgi:hypothetical protein